MAYTELIKNFERVREYMRQFYLYGFKSREEYGIKSARSYDDDRRRIETWLGEYMGFKSGANGKNQKHTAYFKQPHNAPAPLCQAP